MYGQQPYSVHKRTTLACITAQLDMINTRTIAQVEKVKYMTTTDKNAQGRVNHKVDISI